MAFPFDCKGNSSPLAVALTVQCCQMGWLMGQSKDKAKLGSGWSALPYPHLAKSGHE